MNTPRKLTPALFPSATRLLADAFLTNPAHVYICPDHQRRRLQLEWLLGGNLRMQPDLDYSFCLANENEVQAMGFWTRSSGPRPSMLQKVRAGFLAAGSRLGPAGVRRLFEVTSQIDRQLSETFGATPYWYLNNMVVAKDLRGTGVGTRLLAEQLSIVAQAAPSLPSALTTQRPENVVFYERLGFRVAVEHIVGSGPVAFRNWVMSHPPAAR